MSEEPKVFVTEEQFEFMKEQELERTRIINEQREQVVASTMSALHLIANPPPPAMPPLSAYSRSAYLTHRRKVR